MYVVSLRPLLLMAQSWRFLDCCNLLHCALKFSVSSISWGVHTKKNRKKKSELFSKPLPLCIGLWGYVDHLNNKFDVINFYSVSSALDGVKFVWCNSIYCKICLDLLWTKRKGRTPFKVMNPSSHQCFAILLFSRLHTTYVCFIDPSNFSIFFSLSLEHKVLWNHHQENHTPKLVLNEQRHVLVLAKETDTVSAIWFQPGD